ncbi:hypothetical protein U27_01988 [Candidatus Vecturithrix granuli]|uniref:Uncharacterized protein n=1 Tax=Vecturithrix granuli TaxID=1499967 RepID=A0A0S6W6A2_VECG1|nr:hypothetical protein U27_01988 [Candidatus Vecturithrix granuli]
MERAGLKFAETVIAQFDFLTRNYGFACKRCEETFVRYESNKVFVNIYHGRNSYELGGEIGLLGSGKEAKFGIASLMELRDPEKVKDLRYRIAYNEESVQKGLSELASLLQQYGDEALQGDLKIFEQLQQLVKQYWAEMRASQIRPKAASVFQAKDYQKAAELYESMYDQLTKAELKKLEYAKSKELSKNNLYTNKSKLNNLFAKIVSKVFRSIMEKK